MIRSRWFGVVRRGYEWSQSILFAGGWAARLAHTLRLQGQVTALRHEVVVDGAARLPRPLRIAFASDFHAGPLTDVRLLRKAFRSMQEFDPDLVLLGGDFVGLHARHIGGFVDELRCVSAPLGTYAVVGNHDLWKGEEVICQALEAAGVRVLRNTAVRLPSPFEDVVLGGLHDPVIGRPNAQTTFRGHQGVRIALMHSPEGIALLEGIDIAVTFTGHTHGGQVCLPGGRPLLLPSGCWKWKAGSNPIDGMPGGMIVSRGVGVSTLPLRLSCPSEVVLCELKTKHGDEGRGPC